jgi:hypothetical protein
MNTEKKYMEIGKAIIDECMELGEGLCVTITLTGVQYGGKLHIMMEDRGELLSIWEYSDLHAVSVANKQQGARERAEALANKTKDMHVPKELPRIGMLVT